jgi:hypothetical protein
MLLLLLRGGVLVLWFGLANAGSIGTAADTPNRVTTDTPDYCLQLRLTVREIVQHATEPPPWGVAMLEREGRRLCDEGRIHGGITRLRRALIMLEQAQHPRD